jgi:predicted dehydrogenase
MEALLSSGLVEIAALADPAGELLDACAALAPDAVRCASLEQLLERGPALDGVVIATPSAQHAAQCELALAHGLAVFCQKPLARSAAEVERVVAAARRADRLLGVDLSYRFTRATECVRGLVASGELGAVHAVNLVFHNAYGPDKPWFYRRSLSGGGCLVDLGIHLVDLALWVLGFPAVARVTGSLRSTPAGAGGGPPGEPGEEVEDHAAALIELAGGTTVQLSCSWRLHAGADALIEASFYGSHGGVTMHNVDGSFYDFVTRRLRGTRSETVVTPPDDWGGRAAVGWARQLAVQSGFDPEVEHHLEVARVLDAIYASGKQSGHEAGRRA